MQTIKIQSVAPDYLPMVPLETFDKPLWWHLQGLSYTASGYGGKIPTALMVKHENRMKRVYCMIYSNSGTLYILSHGNRIIVTDFN